MEIAPPMSMLYQSTDSVVRFSHCDVNGERSTTPAVHVFASSDCRSGLPVVRSRPSGKYTAFWPTKSGPKAYPFGWPLTPGNCEHSALTSARSGLLATLP